ncbi:MAG: HAMP domain-containing histidine kinase [Acidothermales bacterium]|nr:HAMP domain-containing histidine kinase [Acidothermales bacterium]
MRRRLLLSTLAVASVALLLLGIPVAVIGPALIENRARDRVAREAERLLAVVALRVEADETVDAARLGLLVPVGRKAVVDLPDGRRITAGAVPEGSDTLAATARGEDGYAVRITSAEEDVRQRQAGVWALIAGSGALAVLAATLLAIAQARRLGGPLAELAGSARRLGHTGRTRGRRYGVAELDRVAEELDRSADRVAGMLRAERRLSEDASHQLRTPLTALSMRLEEIASTDDPVVVKEEAEAALTQVERLSGVVDTLLEEKLENRTSQTQPTPVDEVVAQQVEEWWPTFRRAGRRLHVEGSRGLCALSSPGSLGQVLATLLENSLVHGAGTVTVKTRDAGRTAVVEVSDEGAGVPVELAGHVFERAVSGGSSTGLGLAVARALAEADGGRLELVHQRPPVFALFLGVPG